MKLSRLIALLLYFTAIKPMKKTIFRLAATTTAVALGLLSNAKVTLAGENLVFELSNSSTYAITEFYASPSGIEYWEENILANVDVYPYESVNININDGRDVCFYDVMTVFSDGEYLEEYEVDLCDLDGGYYEITED